MSLFLIISLLPLPPVFNQDLESAKSAGELEVAKQPVDRYIMHLVWDYARYNQRRTLPDLVRPPIYI